MEQLSTKAIASKYGLIFVLIIIVYSILLEFVISDIAARQNWGNIGFLFLMVVIIIACREFKRENNGFIRLVQGLNIGLLVGSIGGILNAVYNYLYLTFIDQSVIEYATDKAVQEMAQNPNITDEQIEQGIEFLSTFIINPFAISLMVFIFTILAAVIISLIVGAIMQKSDPNTEF